MREQSVFWHYVYVWFHDADGTGLTCGVLQGRVPGWEWGFEFRTVCRWTSSEKKASDPPQLETRGPSFAHPTPHQTLSRESERWFNFHTGSPHALGCQMRQITYVGILVWSSVHWVQADSSSSFNLSQMDLEPGAKGLKFSPLKYPPYSQTLKSRENQLLATWTSQPDGL